MNLSEFFKSLKNHRINLYQQISYNPFNFG